MKRNKIELEEKNFHQADPTLQPNLKIEIEDKNGARVLVADHIQNTISDHFDIQVISSKLVAKATKRNFGGFTQATASLEIEPVVLIDTIPQRVDFNYSPREEKKKFGINGKLLPNISNIFKCAPLLVRIRDDVDFRKFGQARNSRSLSMLKEAVNAQTGTSDSLKSWIRTNILTEFQDIKELKKLAQLIIEIECSGIVDEIDSYFAAIQVVNQANTLENDFKKACSYQEYLLEKAKFEELIASFTPANVTINPKVEGRKLIVKWPQAHEMSNGQRDVLSFIALLSRAKRKLTKANCILIIDEIFDYLDDANLVSFQYYVTKFIKEMKDEGRNLFPLLMTHLDPAYFRHICFNRYKMKIHYLKKGGTNANEHITKLIRLRGNATIKNEVDKHYFHFYPENCNIQQQFAALDIKKTWGESTKFHQYIDEEVQKYLADQPSYDPIAVCFGTRVKIEENTYNNISDATHKLEFLETNGTKNKLDLAHNYGIEVPEIYYLLGIIYNDRLHWRENLDIVTPLSNRLENLTIKQLVSKVFNHV